MNELRSAPRFIADVMLGRLARWLRVLGYDTLYFSEIDDVALAQRARDEGRILLTRDVELARRRNLRVLLLHDDQIEDQLREVVNRLQLSTDGAFSRCLNCNVPLVDFDPAQARPRVPPYVFATHTRFRGCPACGKIYWRGTHWAHMREVLESADWDESEM